MADATESQLVAALDRLDEQWTDMSPTRIRTLLRNEGFIVSEKRARALKAGLLRSRVETETGSTRCRPSTASCDACASCRATAVLTCSRCMRVKYCSKECQRSHWKAHKSLCAPRSTPSASSTSAAPACPVCESAWGDCQCEDDQKPSCWICLESNGTLLRGCACRGSAGCPTHGCIRTC